MRAVLVATPLRTCLGCRTRRPQAELVRFVMRDGALIDGAGQPGRGAYVCRERAVACFDAASKARRWSRALRTELDPATLIEVRDALERTDGHGPAA